MSHPASDIPPHDPRKKCSFNEAGVCECMNSAGLPFELNLFIRASVISPWHWGNRRPSESWHLCHGWWSRRWTPICRYPITTNSKPVAIRRLWLDWERRDGWQKKKSVVFVSRSLHMFLIRFSNLQTQTHVREEKPATTSQTQRLNPAGHLWLKVPGANFTITSESLLKSISRIGHSSVTPL